MVHIYQWSFKRRAEANCVFMDTNLALYGALICIPTGSSHCYKHGVPIVTKREFPLLPIRHARCCQQAVSIVTNFLIRLKELKSRTVHAKTKHTHLATDYLSQVHNRALQLLRIFSNRAAQLLPIFLMPIAH